MSVAHDLVGSQSRYHVGNKRCGSVAVFPFALGLAELLKTGETIQELDVDAFGRCGQHLTSLRNDAEMRPLGQLDQPGLAQIALRPINTVSKSRLLS